MFQSTPPHGGRLQTAAGAIDSTPVSIHAPAWGATALEDGLVSLSNLVSIHAPAWGATSGRG